MSRPAWDRTPVGRVIFLGGNGHCAARLVPARQAMARLAGAEACRPFEVAEVAYPGFEGREPAADFEAFVAEVARQIAAARAPRELLYATGAGGLIALAARARGAADLPILLQAPVLWGAETRRFPGWMRLPGMAALGRRAVGWPILRGRFSRRCLLRPLPEEIRRDFFRGYARCRAFAQIFAWLNASLLRSLEASFAASPALLERIEVWWGAQDRVVTTEELRLTASALKTAWPLREFPAWGHYPMIDDPESWVREISARLA